MCNLYSMTSNEAALRRLFGVAGAGGVNWPVLSAIFPGQSAPIIRIRDGDRRLDPVVWGFPPPPKGNRPVTNVRNLKSPFWRQWLHDHRCLIPATAFCEWQATTPRKTPIWFRTLDQAVFCFAGIWRPTADGAVFAMLTTEANALVRPVHAQAMPVILAASDAAVWLGGDEAAALALARPYPAQNMEICQQGGRAYHPTVE